MPSPAELLKAAKRLHTVLANQHLRKGLLRGPDAGVRFNLRAWRFLKAAAPSLPWHDDYVFMQTQGYWALANWMLADATGEAHYAGIALDSARAVLREQSSQGTWRYPLPERKHLVATLESMWGAATLLAACAREANAELLDGAVRASGFVMDHIGFQPHGHGEAINYFDRPRGKISNNSVTAVWFLLRLWRATGNDEFLAHVPSMVRFVEGVQMPSGEIPYIVEGPYENARPHYLCFQYNAFQFLYMAWAERAAPGTWSRTVLARLARFLAGGVRNSGACANDCARTARGGPETDYYTAALGAALYEAHRMGLVSSTELSDRCYDRVLERQRPNGGFRYSTGDYLILRDGRSYPRGQAMTLFHLLYACGLGDGFPPS